MSLEDARKALVPFYRREAEHVPISGCYGRVLASDVHSKVDVPGFDRASMDGFAVKAKDTWGADEQNPNALKLTGIIHAGEMPSIAVEPGTAVEIATGAVMPRGANAVVMIEQTDPAGSVVNVRKPVSPGENVMHTGADVMMGELVLREGTRLTSREISVLAAVGLDMVDVYRRPLVGIISTGNEIASPGAKLKPGQIYDVNAYAVGAGVEENGGIPVYLGIVRDQFAGVPERAAGRLQKGGRHPDVRQHLGRGVGHDVRHGGGHGQGAGPRHQDQAGKAHDHRRSGS